MIKSMVVAGKGFAPIMRQMAIVQKIDRKEDGLFIVVVEDGEEGGYLVSRREPRRNGICVNEEWNFES